MRFLIILSLILLAACTPVLLQPSMMNLENQTGTQQSSRPSRFPTHMANGTLSITLPNPCYQVNTTREGNVEYVHILPPSPGEMCIQVLKESNIPIMKNVSKIFLITPDETRLVWQADSSCAGLEGAALQACCERVMQGKAKPACLGSWTWREDQCAWECTITPFT